MQGLDQHEREGFIAVAQPLLTLISHLTGLETTFVTSIDWESQEQTLVLAHNQGDLKLESGGKVAWSDSMCRLMFDKQLTKTRQVKTLFPDSVGAAMGMESFVAVPIRLEEQTLGTLCGASRRELELSDEQIISMELIAQALAVQLKLVVVARTTQAKVESLRDQVENLATLANTDPLTGLLNRRAFYQRYDFAISLTQRSAQPMSVMMIDIDGFKRFNDEFGHDTGDQIIHILSDGIKHIARSTDIPCRMGGDEFVLAALNTDTLGLSLLAERLNNYVKEHTAAIQRSCSLSIGIACSTQGPAQELIRMADEALYVSKARGRDTISIFQPS